MSTVLRGFILFGLLIWSLIWWGGFALVGWGETVTAMGVAENWQWLADIVFGIGQTAIVVIWLFGAIAALALFWLAGFLKSQRVAMAGQQAGRMADSVLDELAKRAGQPRAGTDPNTVTLNKSDDGSYR